MSVRVGLGIAGFPYSSVAALGEWIDLCEASVVDSIWISDRLVGGTPTLEPMAGMAWIAGRTRRLKFGMNAIVLPFRDPLVIAKECATLDFLSGGRLLPAFGVGGDVAPEFRATGRDPRGRGARSDEMLEIMTRLWAGETVTFAGKHFQYTDARISPLPVQAPLPCWIGGSSDAAIRRTATLGTGWLAGLQSPAQVAPVVAKIRAATAEAGRTIDADHYGAGFSFRFGSWDDPIVERSLAAYARLGPDVDARAVFAVGGAAEIIAKAREYLGAGVSKFVLRPIGGDDAEIMDQTRRLIDEVLPVVHAW
ncbi:MAG: TIGR03619 family F420-dependent LLM class oxidoreductase [Dehalococcoidia bacterium]|nr:TIGR03619 family F420-dependent LLM class oxidoreductase [Dehalococcoidia bacterium]